MPRSVKNLIRFLLHPRRDVLNSSHMKHIIEEGLVVKFENGAPAVDRIIVREVFGNYYGYKNNEKVEIFLGTPREQLREAKEWFKLETL